MTRYLSIGGINTAKKVQKEPIKQDNKDYMQKWAILEETLLTSKKTNTKVLNILEKAYKTNRVMQDKEIEDIINKAYNELITSDMEV